MELTEKDILEKTGINIPKAFDDLDNAVKELVLVRAQIAILGIAERGTKLFDRANVDATVDAITEATMVGLEEAADVLDKRAASLRKAAREGSKKESPTTDRSPPPGIAV